MSLIEYGPKLQEKINKMQLIEENSPEEKAIRGATIIVCEYLSQKDDIEIPALDRYLWLMRNNYKNPFNLTKANKY